MTEEVVSGAAAEGSDEEAMREHVINLADKGAASKNETSVETSDGVTNDRRTPRAVRRYLPDERCGITHKFAVGGQEGYVTVGLFEDGLPGEIFIRISNMKELRFDAADGVWRVAFAFDPNRKAVLLVCGDKSGSSEKRFYRQLIEKADTRFDAHLGRIKRGREKQKEEGKK